MTVESAYGRLSGDLRRSRNGFNSGRGQARSSMRAASKRSLPHPRALARRVARLSPLREATRGLAPTRRRHRERRSRSGRIRGPGLTGICMVR